MFFKILCLALLACTLGQTEGRNTTESDEERGIVESIRQGARELKDLKPKIQDAVFDGIKAKSQICKSLPRFLWKLWQKSTNQTEISFPDNIRKSAQEIIDENTEIKKKAIDSSLNAARAVFNTTARAMSVTTSFSQFLTNLIEAVGFRSDLSDAEMTEVRAAMKEISPLIESKNDAQKDGSKSTSGQFVYKKKFKPSNIAGSDV